MEWISELLDHVLSAMGTVPLWQLYLVVGVLLILETTVAIGLITPGEVVLLAAATTVGSVGEYVGLAAVAAVASLIGQTGGYLIGRRFGGPLRASRVGRWVGDEHWATAERVLRGGTGRALVGSRFLAVAHSLVPVVAGTLRMPVRRYARYTVIGAVVWALVYVGLGSAASVAVRGSAHLLGPTVTTIAVAGVAIALLVRMLRKRRAARSAAPEPTPTTATTPAHHD